MNRWATSTRKQRLPGDWQQRRTIVLIRDRRRCQLQHEGCTTVATEVDHRIAGDDHSIANLQAACSTCHRAKTLAEATTARQAKLTERRPPERHPGLLH